MLVTNANEGAATRPVPYTLGEVHRHPPFAFQELYPGGETS